MQIAYEGALEIRQLDGRRILSGRFPYNALATVSDRGRRRKETFASGAFDFAIDDPERRIDLLVGHDFGKPLASRQSGTLTLESSAEGVSFEARLPDDPPSWVVDAERAVDAGLMTGISPGFRVPPRNVVPDAETILPEPGNPLVDIRQINHAVLREFSIVTAPAYLDAAVELRADDFDPGVILGAETLWL